MRHLSGIKLLLVLVAVFAAYAVGVWRQSGQQLGASAVQGYVGFEPAEIDLGDVPWARTIPFRLVLVNRAKESFTVVSAQSTCDCTVIDQRSYEGRIVNAGDSLPIDLTIDTQKNPGRKLRRVEVTASTGRTYSASVMLNVVGTWSVQPDTIDFGDVLLDGSEAPEDRLAAYDSPADELLEVSAPGVAWLECYAAPRGEGEAQAHEILFRVLKERLPPGSNNATIVVRTSNTIKSTAAIYVKARGTYQLISRPFEIHLVGSTPVTVEFFDRHGQAQRIVVAECANTAVRIQIQPDGSLEICNSSGRALPEVISVRVTSSEGLSRTLDVSAF